MIQNCPFTPKDINNAPLIFGPDLKGIMGEGGGKFQARHILDGLFGHNLEILDTP